MNRTTRILLGILIIVIGMMMFFNRGTFFKNAINQEAAINLSGIDHIMISGVSEDITVSHSSKHALNAELTGSSWGFGFTKPKLIVEKQGDTLEVKVERSGLSLFQISDLKLDIDLSDAYRENMTITLTSGDSQFLGTYHFKEVVIDLTSGQVAFEGLQTEKTRLKVTSGNVVINDFMGDLDGTITSGRIMVDYALFDNDINFKATSGNIDFYLPKKSNFELDTDKTSGTIKTDFELTALVNDSNQLKGVSGSGGNQINLKVTSGNISILEK